FDCRKDHLSKLPTCFITVASARSLFEYQTDCLCLRICKVLCVEIATPVEGPFASYTTECHALVSDYTECQAIVSVRIPKITDLILHYRLNSLGAKYTLTIIDSPV